MDLLGAQLDTAKHRGPRGAGIFYHSNVKAKITRRPRCRINAHLAHGATEGQRLNPGLLQQIQQARVDKTIGPRLGQNRLTCGGGNGAMDVSPVAARAKERCLGRRVFMADMHHHLTSLTGRGKQRRGIFRRLLHPMQLPVASWEVIVLNIHQQ